MGQLSLGKLQHKQETAQEAGVECRIDLGGQGPSGGGREKDVGSEVVLGAGEAKGQQMN